MLVIVHPSGGLDDRRPNHAYWTEVPAHPTCFVEAETLQEAVNETRALLNGWYKVEVPIRVEMAV